MPFVQPVEASRHAGASESPPCLHTYNTVASFGDKPLRPRRSHAVFAPPLRVSEMPRPTLGRRFPTILHGVGNTPPHHGVFREQPLPPVGVNAPERSLQRVRHLALLDDHLHGLGCSSPACGAALTTCQRESDSGRFQSALPMTASLPVKDADRGLRLELQRLHGLSPATAP